MYDMKTKSETEVIPIVRILNFITTQNNVFNTRMKPVFVSLPVSVPAAESESTILS
jgi:hypothetical protein